MLAQLIITLLFAPAYAENPLVLGPAPWQSQKVEGESSALLEEVEGGALIARMSRKAKEVLEVRSANRDRVYQAGTDFTVDAEGGKLVFKGDAKEGLKLSQLYPAKGSPSSYPSRVGHPEQAMLYGPGRWFHDHQLEMMHGPERRHLRRRTSCPKRLPCSQVKSF